MKKNICCIVICFLVICFLNACGGNSTIGSQDEEPTPVIDPQETNTEDSTTPIPEVLTGNALLDAEVHTTSSGSEKHAYIQISKADALQVSMKEYLDFTTQRIDNHGYNWWTIIFDDGTGLVYTGSLSYSAEYGILNNDDTISHGYGYLYPNKDGTYEYREYEKNELSTGELKVYSELICRTFDEGFGAELATQDEGNGYFVTTDDTGVVVNVWFAGVAQEFASAQKRTTHGKSFWKQFRISIMQMTCELQGVIDSIDKSVGDVDLQSLSLTVNLLDDTDQETILMTVSNGAVIYDALIDQPA